MSYSTYRKIQTVTVTATTAAAIEFTSIPATYTDIAIHISARTTNTAVNDYFVISFNGSTSNFSNKYLGGSGSSAFSSSIARFAGDANGDGSTSNTFSSTFVYIPNYTSSVYKSFSVDSVNESNVAFTVYSSLSASLWSDNAAINSISFATGTGSYNFKQYSTATLYGIKRA